MEFKTRNYDHLHHLFATKSEQTFFKLKGLCKMGYTIHPFVLVLNIVYEN